jgi:glycine betaine/proline transport system substrate-binding protein
MLVRDCGLAVLALVAAGMLAPVAGSAAEPASCHKVRMAEPGWTDLALTTGITSVLLKGLGYEPQSDVLGIEVIYQAMKHGQLDLFMGYWDPAMEVYYKPYQQDGSVETVKQNLEGAKFTFAVPTYVYDAGVHDFADLAAHADKFDHKMYGIEPGSNTIMENIIKANAFGLGDWKLVESSEQGMLAQVRRSAEKKDWIVFLGWAPHPMNVDIDMRYLTGGDDYYGPNYGGATVHTQVRKGYLAECPNIAKLVDNLTFTVDLENVGMGYILDENASPTDAARQLIAKHPDLLDRWLAGVQTADGAEGEAAVKASLGL